MSSESGTPYTIATKCAAEFVAVMAFVTVGSLQAMNTGDGIVRAALCHGVAIFILVSVFAHISGGHVNPAVTLGVAAAGKMRPIEAVFYVIAQLAGGLFGALIVRAVLSYNQYVTIQGGATLCAAGIQWYQGLLAEIATTFLLVQTVLVTAVDGSTALAPLAIGFTVLMDILAVGGISGASMNPGRSFGPNIVASIFMKDELADGFWSLHWIYYLGPAIGALIAVGLYR
ncbi:channel protein, MIP family [Ancylostoma ceylanicum]|uniref:Channel protein, MIP family n=1 Tax=Ancylostoma ceylanicum TaxID=53326 RepID=A0A0D6L915_9BILA|nr:channel protein, MIP family [Ancylostoma ceylanicum]